MRFNLLKSSFKLAHKRTSTTKTVHRRFKVQFLSQLCVQLNGENCFHLTNPLGVGPDSLCVRWCNKNIYFTSCLWYWTQAFSSLKFQYSEFLVTKSCIFGNSSQSNDNNNNNDSSNNNIHKTTEKAQSFGPTRSKHVLSYCSCSSWLPPEAPDTNAVNCGRLKHPSHVPWSRSSEYVCFPNDGLPSTSPTHSKP